MTEMKERETLVDFDKIGQILELECRLYLEGDRSRDLEQIIDALWAAKELATGANEYHGGKPCEWSYLCAVNKCIASDDLAAIETALRHCLLPEHQVGKLKVAIQSAILVGVTSLKKMPETSFTPVQLDQIQQEALENYFANLKSNWALT